MSHLLDLRGVSCPMNFVKTRLFLDKLDKGAVLEVILDRGEPTESVYASVCADGHLVQEPKARDDGTFSVIIEKV